MNDQAIARINELYHKSKTPEGLTEEEKAEQAALRIAYLDAIRGNLRATLNNTVVEYPDGRVVPLKEAGLKVKVAKPGQSNPSDKKA